MRNGASVVLTAACVLAMIAGMATYAAVSTEIETADNLKGGSNPDIVFTKPADYPWVWELRAETAPDWEHKPGTQDPDCFPWMPTGFNGRSGHWTSAVIEDSDSPERNFQRKFTGKLRELRGPDSGGGGSGGEPKFTINARAGEYFVKPPWPLVCVDDTVTLDATDKNGDPVVSTWGIAPPDGIDDIDLFNGVQKNSSVTFSSSEPDVYTVTGTKDGDSTQYDSAVVTFIKMNLVGVDGDGFVLTDTGEYANRVWFGTWLNLKPEPDLFDWGILKKYGGGVILSRQEFSWELTDIDNGQVHPGSKGPMYFVDEFEVDSNGELIPRSSKDNGVWPAEPPGTGYGMHMSLFNIQVGSLVWDNFTQSFNIPYKDYEGHIEIKFTAELYLKDEITNPTSGFNSESSNNIYHPFYPEIAHKYWSSSEPSWAGSDPICIMEQTFEITWDGDTSLSCSPTLPNGPNRLEQ